MIVISAHYDRRTENFNVFDFELSAEDMEKITALDKKQSAFSHIRTLIWLSGLERW